MPARFTTVASPIGELTLVADDAGSPACTSRTTGTCPTRPPSGPASDPGFDEVQRQLAEYFAGERDRFDLPVDARGDEFQRRVWDLISRIPYGQTTTYGDLARELGERGRVLAKDVGAAVGRNPLCVHRALPPRGRQERQPSPATPAGWPASGSCWTWRSRPSSGWPGCADRAPHVLPTGDVYTT